MLGVRKKILLNDYLRAFFSFSNLKINLYIIFFAIISFISSLLDISLIYYISNIVFSLTQDKPVTKDILYFKLTFDYTNINVYLYFFILCLLAYTTKVCLNYYNYQLGAIFSNSLTGKFLKAFSNVSYEYYINQKQSEFINNYIEDINKSTGCLNATLSCISYFINFLIYISFVFITVPIKLSFLILIFAVLNYVIINNIIGKKIIRIGKKMNSNNPIRVQKLMDFYSLFKEIKVFNISNILLKSVLKVDTKYKSFEAKAPFLISLPSTTIIHLFYLLSVSFIFFQSQIKLFDIYLNSLVALGLILQRTIPILNLIVSSLSTIKLKSLFLIKIYKQYDQMLTNSRDYKLLQFYSNYKKNTYKFEKENYIISLRDINYKHQNSRIKLYKNNLNFDILPKSNYLIQGPSGSGKSTLIDLILGLRKPSNGNLYFNNIYKSLSDLICYVPQETFCIDDTFLKNLTLFDAISLSKTKLKNIKDILECVLLNELVDNFPNGILQKIGYGGIKLSGGQLQRLSIARALYRKAPILLMDEPTSSLDEENSKCLMNNLLSYAFKNSMSLVVVSHDSSIAHLFCNQIKL
tara:strand:- start:31582 stop:33318 length:1737 start_codon:yes stop_codon:yes gene_type:complete